MSIDERRKALRELADELENAAKFLRHLPEGIEEQFTVDFYEGKFGYIENAFYFKRNNKIFEALYCEECGRFLNRKLECSECTQCGEECIDSATESA